MAVASTHVARVETALRAAGCVFAAEEAALLVDATADHDSLAALVQRRVDGEPLEHVLGWAQFATLRIKVGPGVFVPRRRTEFVARVASRLVPAGGTLVDLCCGSGAIAAVVAHARPDVTVTAADIDPVAIAFAARNLAPFGAAAIVSDMDSALDSRLGASVDIVTACAPYVPTREIALMPHEARDFEPIAALDGGADGTDVQARVFEAATRLLRPGGVAIVETSDHLLDASIAAARRLGMTASSERDDDAGAVVVIASV